MTVPFVLNGAVTLAQPEYDFILIDAFQTTYARRTSTVNDISDTNRAIGWATDLSQVFSISAFSWTWQAEKTRLPDSQIDRAINSLGVSAGAMLVHTPWDNLVRTIPGVNSTYGRMRATGLNDSTIVVGYAEVSAGSNSSGLSQVAFWWDPTGGTHPIPVVEARELLRINNAGLAVGNIRHVSGGISEAFTYNVHTGQSVNLGAILPAGSASPPFSTAADIAENGLVAGNLLVFNGTVNARTVFTWSVAAGFSVQQVLTGPDCEFMAQGVNSAGSVVGYRRTPTNDVTPNTAVIWDAHRGVRDLNSLVTVPPGFVIRRAVKINENGWIAAQGVFSAEPSFSRGVILRPRGALCIADIDDGSGAGTPDGGVTIEDLLFYLTIFGSGDVSADLDNGSSSGTRDGGVTIEDLLYFLMRFDAGC
jgi:hypothetical protein